VLPEAETLRYQPYISYFHVIGSFCFIFPCCFWYADLRKKLPNVKHYYWLQILRFIKIVYSVILIKYFTLSIYELFGRMKLVHYNTDSITYPWFVQLEAIWPRLWLVSSYACYEPICHVVSSYVFFFSSIKLRAC
jgi:hypothetical protein